MLDLKHSNKENVCVIYGQQASKVPFPSHFCILSVITDSVSVFVLPLGNGHTQYKSLIMKMLWASNLKSINSVYLCFLFYNVLSKRSGDGSYSHIQFEKRRWHLVWIP
jgi:hypothetical protein